MKGYTDIFGGILPPVPGFYFRTDAYHYNGDAERTIFNGFAQVGVEEDYTATIAALTYVTPWKILGGTYAVAVVPSMVAMDVDVGIGIPQFTGPLGLRTFGPFNFKTGDTNLSSLAGRRQLPLERRRVRLCADRRLQHAAACQYEPGHTFDVAFTARF